MNRLCRAASWMFRNRQTGAITIAQMPNFSSFLMILLVLVRAILRPNGVPLTLVATAGVATKLWWGSDELLRGVNPFRRLLGAGCIAYVLARTSVYWRTTSHPQQSAALPLPMST